MITVVVNPETESEVTIATTVDDETVALEAYGYDPKTIDYTIQS